MEQVMDFLTQSGVFFLATTGGGRPHVRPMGFVMEWEGKLAFCTSNQKEMHAQLAANPYMEVSCVDGERNTLRLWGKAAFVTSEDSQRKALEVMPALSAAYAVGDGKFEIFCLEDAKATCCTMSGDMRVLEL